MSTSSADSGIVPGKRYRFVVASAAEAANAIRDKLGETAKVLSVRQIEGEGLARFLRAPKLEVIACIPEVETPPPNLSPPQSPAISPSPDAPSSIPGATPLGSSASPSSHPAQSHQEIAGQQSSANPADSLSPFSQEPPVAQQTQQPESRLVHILRRAGLPDSFLLRFAADPDWQEIQRLPLSTAFPRAVLHLRNAIPRRSIVAATRRVAFFGSPGAGSTTALCKQLAAEIFLRNRPACVMKLDGEEPNSTEALAMYCEALGIPLLRSSTELMQVENDVIVYFDVPGAISDPKARKRLHKALSDYGISSRVLVINTSYERELIKHFYQHSAELGTTHVVFTHMDELLHYGKLWEFVLDPGLSPLFASTGPNLAGDCERDVIGLLVRKTLAVRA